VRDKDGAVVQIHELQCFGELRLPRRAGRGGTTTKKKQIRRKELTVTEALRTRNEQLRYVWLIKASFRLRDFVRAGNCPA